MQLVLEVEIPQSVGGTLGNSPRVVEVDGNSHGVESGWGIPDWCWRWTWEFPKGVGGTLGNSPRVVEVDREFPTGVGGELGNSPKALEAGIPDLLEVDSPTTANSIWKSPYPPRICGNSQVHLLIS
jgi:hypothetical protein